MSVSTDRRCYRSGNLWHACASRFVRAVLFHSRTSGREQNVTRSLVNTATEISTKDEFGFEFEFELSEVNYEEVLGQGDSILFRDSESSSYRDLTVCV